MVYLYNIISSQWLFMGKTVPSTVHALFTLLLLVSCSAIAIEPVSSSHERQPNSAIFESWGSTEIKIARLRYTWTINNWSFCCQNNNKILISPTFSDGTNDGCAWKLHLTYPIEVSHYHDENYLSLQLSLNGCPAKAQYKFGILNAKKKEINVVNNTFDFNEQLIMTLPERLVKQDFLLDEENEVIVHNKLTIFCEINATIGIENFSQKYNPFLPKSHLKKDLEFLFENEAYSDVTISTGGIEFKALKAILAARSSVFKTMFELKNPKSTMIEMNDTDHQVVKEMLRYMYTDEPSNLEYLAPELLAVAGKYKLNGLKSICENVMLANLTVENAVKFYILGDTYSAFELKYRANDFIAAHVSDVIHTLEFKSLLRTHPHLVEEVFDAVSQKNYIYIESRPDPARLLAPILPPELDRDYME